MIRNNGIKITPRSSKAIQISRNTFSYAQVPHSYTVCTPSRAGHIWPTAGEHLGSSRNGLEIPLPHWPNAAELSLLLYQNPCKLENDIN